MRLTMLSVWASGLSWMNGKRNLPYADNGSRVGLRVVSIPSDASSETAISNIGYTTRLEIPQSRIALINLTVLTVFFAENIAVGIYCPSLLDYPFTGTIE